MALKSELEEVELVSEMSVWYKSSVPSLSSRMSSCGSKILVDGEEEREEEKDAALDLGRDLGLDLDREREDDRDLVWVPVGVEVPEARVLSEEGGLSFDRDVKEEDSWSCSGRAWRWKGAALISS